MLDEGLFFAEPILAPVDAFDLALLPDVDGSLFFSPSIETRDDALIPFDQWGLTQIPTVSGYNFVPQYKAAWVNPTIVPVADVALGVILDYLATFLVTDANATAAWQTVAPGGPAAVVRIFPHDPSKVAFSETYCPALFMWRESSSESWEADDWLRESTVVKAFWVYPRTLQENQRQRQIFAHILSKLITLAIERGRTIGWQQPADPDHLAASQGSLLYTYANFEYFQLESSRVATLQIDTGAMVGASTESFPAVEFTFGLWEKVDFGLGRSPPMYRMQGGFESILNPQGNVVVSGPLDRVRDTVTASMGGSPHTLATVSPNSVGVGIAQAVTLSGVGFQQGALVVFGSGPATSVDVVSPTSITCVAPASTVGGPVWVSVINPDGTTANAYSAYTYIPQSDLMNSVRVTLDGSGPPGTQPSPYTALPFQTVVADTSVGSVVIVGATLGANQWWQVKHDPFTSLSVNTVTVNAPAGVNLEQPVGPSGAVPPGSFSSSLVLNSELQRGSSFKWFNGGSAGGLTLDG